MTVSMLHLKSSQCPDIVFLKGSDGYAVCCGQPVGEKGTYCVEHARVYYAESKSQKRRTHTDYRSNHKEARND